MLISTCRACYPKNKFSVEESTACVAAEEDKEGSWEGGERRVERV
jgi:hypothetical protein